MKQPQLCRNPPQPDSISHQTSFTALGSRGRVTSQNTHTLVGSDTHSGMLDAYRPSRLRRDRPVAARVGWLFVVLAAVGVWTMGIRAVYIQLAPDLVASPRRRVRWS